MKLYIVQSVNRILGVFSSREAAELTLDAFHARYANTHFSAHIIEMSLSDKAVDF